MERRAVVVQVVLLGCAALVLDLAQLLGPRRAVGPPGAGLAQSAERGGNAAEELRRHLARVGALGRGRAHDHDLGLVAERGAEAEAEVHRHSDHQRHVGALQPGPARTREELRVVGRHAAARQAVQEHWDPELLSQRPQLRLAACPVEPGPGHDHRALCAAQQLGGTRDRVAVGSRGAARVLKLGGRVGVHLRVHEHVVEREVEEGRTRGRLHRHAEGLVHDPGDVGGGFGGARQLGHRRHERHVVDLLERALAPAHGRGAASEHEQRGSVLQGRRHPAHAVGDARTGG